MAETWALKDCTDWPNENDKCWDCGSTIPNHHTQLCDFATDDDVRDLPAVPDTQWWTGEKPSYL